VESDDAQNLNDDMLDDIDSEVMSQRVALLTSVKLRPLQGTCILHITRVGQ
jgi:hypothetical protein